MYEADNMKEDHVVELLVTALNGDSSGLSTNMLTMTLYVAVDLSFEFVHDTNLTTV